MINKAFASAYCSTCHILYNSNVEFFLEECVYSNLTEDLNKNSL